MPGKAYPKRGDDVTYEQFDGSFKSAQIIARLTRDNVHIKISPNVYVGDSISAIEIGTGALVVNGYYVVVKDEWIKVLSYDEFNAAYSKDGN